jgi:uncharacterized membrane protein YqaE (UPF0057 family)
VLTPALIAAAILLPPLAIFLSEGAGRNFWIGCALTCLGYLPGVAFAFYALLSRRGETAAA